MIIWHSALGISQALKPKQNSNVPIRLRQNIIEAHFGVSNQIITTSPFQQFKKLPKLSKNASHPIDNSLISDLCVPNVPGDPGRRLKYIPIS